MENEFDLQVSNHDFNAAKEQLKKFAEQDVEELKFDKVRTHEDIFGLEWAEHGVTGKELNSLIEKLQKYFSKVYDRDQNLIEEFGEVYKALEALDKDYIQAILTSVSAIKKTNEKILIEQERIDQTIEKQKATLIALKQFKENVSNTRYAAALADEYGASIEAELGAMGAEGVEDNIMGAYTDPELAKIFVEETGIDALAASFGTVHGIYKSEPKLDFERIENIRELTGVPVVMHGGSGISDEEFRRCIDRGVRKINFYTYAAKFAGDAIRKMAEDTSGNLYSHDVFVTARESMKQTYRDAIRVFKNE